MKKIYIVVLLIVFLVMSCEPWIDENDYNTYYTFFKTTTTTTTVRHNYTTTTTVKTPNDWAMLDIVDRYDVPDATFANWQDGHIYMICTDSIKIIDMSDDTSGDRITIVDEIPFSLNDLSGDWAELKGCGIADIGTKILMLANLKNEDTSVKTLLSIRHDGSEFMFSDVTKDLVTTTPIYSIYYDSTAKILSSIHSGSGGAMLVKSLYDETNDTFVLQSQMPCDEYYITNKFYYRLYWDKYPSRIYNAIYKMSLPYGDDFWTDHSNLGYLGIINPILSAFYNGKSFFIFIREDKPEFIKVTFRPWR